MGKVEVRGFVALKLCFGAAIVIILASATHGNDTGLVHRRFEYKYSFKPPYLAQKDSSVPFWEYGGNAIAGSDKVRVAPSLKSQKGAIWTKQPTNFDWWEADVQFRVTGRGRIGADGLAFWYVTERGDYNGEVYGASDRWVGLGIFFDSFDNDNKHNNPYIMAVVNDGTRNFDHENDGKSQALAGCLRDFRNKPFPTRAKIEYYQNVLTVMFHGGMNNNAEDYEVCLRAENVVLPKHGYFGISAATGGLADDHDVYHFLTTSLLPADPSQQGVKQPGGEENDKLSLEYQEYQKKLEQQKEDYRKEHPELEAKDDLDDFFENDRELRQIWQAQSSMTEALRELSRKMDNMIGRQEQTIGMIAPGGVPPPQIQGQHGGQPPTQNFQDTIRRPEVDALMGNNNYLVQVAKELRTILGEIQIRTDSILTNQARQPTAQIQSTGYDVQSMMNEMRDGLNQVKQGVANVGARIGTNPQAQTGGCPSCVSMTAILVITAVQLSVMLAYSLFKESRQAQAKKFY